MPNTPPSIPTAESLLQVWGRVEAAHLGVLDRDPVEELRRMCGLGSPGRQIITISALMHRYVETTPGFGTAKPALSWIYALGRSSEDFVWRGPGQDVEAALRERSWTFARGCPDALVANIVCAWYRRILSGRLLEEQPVFEAIDVDEATGGQVMTPLEVRQHNLLLSLRRARRSGRLSYAQQLERQLARLHREAREMG